MADDGDPPSDGGAPTDPDDGERNHGDGNDGERNHGDGNDGERPPGEEDDEHPRRDGRDGRPPGDGSDVDDANDSLRANPHVGRGLLDEAMGPSSAMAHLYRGEVHRMMLWRERLDQTTNWAVVVIAAILTWAFSSARNPHYVVVVGMAVVAMFLVVEAHRYRAYDVWRSRVRAMQENVFAYGLDPSQGLADENWRTRLADDYRTPTVKITDEEAIAHRLRRVYLPLFTVLLAAWFIRVGAFDPTPWPESAAIGSISGVVVTVAVLSAYGVAAVVALRPRTWQARDELRTENLRRYR